MADTVFLLAEIASGVGGVATIYAYLRMRRALSGEGPTYVSPSPSPAPAESKRQEKHNDSERVGFVSWEARRRQIEIVVKDLFSTYRDESGTQPTYSLHELEILLSWKKADSKPLSPTICDRGLKALHREYLSKWAKGADAVKAKTRALESGNFRNKNYKLLDEFDAFPEMPSFEAITKRFELRSRAKNLFSGVLFIFCLGVSGLIGISAESIGVGIFAFFFLAFLLGAVLNELIEHMEATLSTPLWNWTEKLHGTGEDALSRRETFYPKSIYWHPYLPLIFVTKDHLHFNSWIWKKLDQPEGGEKPSRSAMRGGQCVFSQGWINNVSFSRKYALVESENKWNIKDNFTDHSVLIDSYGDVVAHISSYGEGAPRVFGIKKKMTHDSRGTRYRIEGPATECGERYFHASTLDAIDDYLSKQHEVKARLDVEVVRLGLEFGQAVA
uniref:Uncharacterized protein n=1 Tax=Candidatus Kentrum sp. FW TaxID=2126338 RepID=A0A450T5Q0_9GAMM|nr:MAG: hypothetical protein BECKFW1821B_GA0114236_106718 [Candidatus Kentron sp. FW]